jgi:hypothetical protein
MFCSQDSKGYKQYSHALKRMNSLENFVFFNIQNICRVYSIQIELKQVVVLRILIPLIDKFVSKLSVDPILRKLKLKKKFFSFSCLDLIISDNKAIFIIR